MKIRISTLLVLPIAIVSLATSGCASHSEVTTIRNDLNETRRTADRALTLAEEANRRSERNEEMINRSFKHSMRK